MIILGLTGSIGMGKSTVAGFFKEAGIPVYSADQTVHQLYSQPNICQILEETFPGSTKNGNIDRQKLSQIVLNQPELLKKLESIIHPLVRQQEKVFIEKARQQKADLVVMDIPLLFETGNQQRFDKILVVSAPYEIQRERVLARDNMSAEKFQAILDKQMPDENKKKVADFVIDTSKGLEVTRQDVQTVIDYLINQAE